MYLNWRVKSLLEYLFVKFQVFAINRTATIEEIQQIFVLVKTSSRRLRCDIFLPSKTSWRRLKDVLKTQLQDVLQTRLEDVLEDVLKTSCKTSSRHFRKTYCKYALVGLRGKVKVSNDLKRLKWLWKFYDFFPEHFQFFLRTSFFLQGFFS